MRTVEDACPYGLCLGFLVLADVKKLDDRRGENDVGEKLENEVKTNEEDYQIRTD